MNLWIRSTSKTNLLQARFLTIMEGKTFYKKNEWEYEGYTICNVALNGNYELLGTYKTKERAIEVLDEIQDKMLNGAFAKKINGLGEELDLIPNQILIYNMPED